MTTGAALVSAAGMREQKVLVDCENRFDPAALVDPARLPCRTTLLDPLRSQASDFEDGAGRGASYRRAQEDLRVREVGIRSMLDYLIEPFGPNASEAVLLDALGGDGLVARLAAQTLPADRLPRIITSDLSQDMVRAAEAHGLPAVWQAAQALVLRDASVDGVLIAYGTHHIPVAERVLACQEARRVLRPGGRLAVHDFDVTSPHARWFEAIVDRWYPYGHPFQHVTAETLAGYLTEAGLDDVQVRLMYDPLLFRGSSVEDAWRVFADTSVDMYGLHPMVQHYGEATVDVLRDFALDTYTINASSIDDFAFLGSGSVSCTTPTTTWHGHGYTLEIPRLSLVATGSVPMEEAG